MGLYSRYSICVSLYLCPLSLLFLRTAWGRLLNRKSRPITLGRLLNRKTRHLFILCSGREIFLCYHCSTNAHLIRYSQTVSYFLWYCVQNLLWLIGLTNLTFACIYKWFISQVKRFHMYTYVQKVLQRSYGVQLSFKTYELTNLVLTFSSIFSGYCFEDCLRLRVEVASWTSGLLAALLFYFCSGLVPWLRTRCRGLSIALLDYLYNYCLFLWII